MKIQLRSPFVIHLASRWSRIIVLQFFIIIRSTLLATYVFIVANSYSKSTTIDIYLKPSGKYLYYPVYYVKYLLNYLLINNKKYNNIYITNNINDSFSSIYLGPSIIHIYDTSISIKALLSHLNISTPIYFILFNILNYLIFRIKKLFTQFLYKYVLKIKINTDTETYQIEKLDILSIFKAIINKFNVLLLKLKYIISSIPKPKPILISIGRFLLLLMFIFNITIFIILIIGSLPPTPSGKAITLSSGKNVFLTNKIFYFMSDQNTKPNTLEITIIVDYRINNLKGKKNAFNDSIVVWNKFKSEANFAGINLGFVRVIHHEWLDRISSIDFRFERQNDGNWLLVSND